MPSDCSPTGRGRFLAACATALFAASCASGPYTTTLKLVGTDGLNPTLDDTPSSVNVRVFPLLSRAAFDAAKSDDLLASPPKLQSQAWAPPFTDTVVYVGQVNDLEVEIEPEVKHLGIIGLFNDVEGKYQEVIDVGDISESQVVFDKYTLLIAPRSGENR